MRYGAVLVAVVLTARVTLATDVAALRIGTSGDYKPFSFRDAAGTLSGFDIAVAERLAADLGRRFEFVPFQWPALTDQLVAGTFDIAMSGVTVRADRALQVVFSRPYAVTGAVAVIRAEDRNTLRTVTDLDNALRRLAVNAGGHLERVARERFPHATVVPIVDNGRLPDLLLGGAADAVISDAIESRSWPAERIKIIGPFTHDRKAYAVRPGDGALLRQVNDWLAAREADGWLDAQRRRWLGEPAALTPPQAGFEGLVAAMDLRLQLMPFVAAVKRRERLPIEDPAQEARVLERVRSAAAEAALNADDVAALFRVQMNAAKAVEHDAGLGPEPAGTSLAAVRAAVAAVSDQIIAELVRCQTWLQQPALRDDLDRIMRAGLTAAGVTPSTKEQLRDALHRVRRDTQ